MTNSPHSPAHRRRRRTRERDRRTPLNRLSATTTCAPARTVRSIRPIALTNHIPAARGAFASDKTGQDDRRCGEAATDAIGSRRARVRPSGIAPKPISATGEPRRGDPRLAAEAAAPGSGLVSGAADRSSAGAVTDRAAAPAACREAVVVADLGRAYKVNGGKARLSHKQRAAHRAPPALRYLGTFPPSAPKLPRRSRGRISSPNCDAPPAHSTNWRRDRPGTAGSRTRCRRRNTGMGCNTRTVDRTDRHTAGNDCGRNSRDDCGEGPSRSPRQPARYSRPLAPAWPDCRRRTRRGDRSRQTECAQQCKSCDAHGICSSCSERI